MPYQNTNTVFIQEDSSNEISMFTEAFLEDKNQDCLEQVLSFLCFTELVASAKTCKSLQHIIFEATDEEANINRIWHGAEIDLVKHHDRFGNFMIMKRYGANAREHCRLFAVGSAAAKEYERSAVAGEIEENRMMVDGVVANLMNVRGFNDDEECIRGVSETDLGILGPILSNFFRMPPEKVYHHRVFVRVSQASTQELICQGFCEYIQKRSWDEGLEPSGHRKQGLELLLDFTSLRLSDEMQSYLEYHAATAAETDETLTLGFRVTAVVVNENDHSCQCLFQQHRTKDLELFATGKFSNLGIDVKKHCFGLSPTWRWDSGTTIQMGPCPYRHQFYLDFSLTLCISDYGVVPRLEVDVA